MKRYDEEFAKAQFDAFLGRLFARPEIVWEEVAQQDEPPDYYLSLGELRFAVEVTTLVDLISVGAARPLPYGVVRRLLHGFAKRVEEAARAERYLRGRYLIIFHTPIDDLTNVEEEIEHKLLDYIRRTEDAETYPLETAFARVSAEGKPERCEIVKIGSRPTVVLPGGPVVMKWEGEAKMDIWKLLEESLESKADKLKDIAEPKILVLLDEYHLADRSMYEDCAHRLSSCTQFHTLYVISALRTQGQHARFVLCSVDRSWSTAT